MRLSLQRQTSCMTQTLSGRNVPATEPDEEVDEELEKLKEEFLARIDAADAEVNRLRQQLTVCFSPFKNLFSFLKALNRILAVN